MTDATLTPEQQARIERLAALSDAERSNVLFLLSVSDGARADWALSAVGPSTAQEMEFILAAPASPEGAQS
ncbi:MAG: hypothetical protein M3Y33_08555 [Actinomycetota bacterium]|nr:hypothetical protein [Actinomycetota bacterium]